MERRLVLMRHGEAAAPEGLGRDRDRPLTLAGHRQVGRVAEQLAREAWVPDVVVCSDARRATETALLLCRKLGIGAPLLLADLYDDGPRALWDAAAELPDGKALLAVGHNPGLSAAASRLAGQPVVLGTADAARFVLEGSTWAEALQGTATPAGVVRSAG